ncbi:Cell wall-associated hydrolase, NlpC family [Trichlorobacter thiogenes]|uniref:Cell wall-associated hydrolase, NlpC family n=1 Tax=Trichlorobacter thiogenes TaxID=115783 RepID=A0A1T4JVM0_9BACT|nr:NlpC/P60 family protein [Trichlorobacter thiogenes]SJZ34169.1 Cell wall-associated hydrolase, NlpC family [Trichlorobacter thiogenes]
MIPRCLSILVAICLLWPLSLATAESPRFAIARKPTPVFNNPQSAGPQTKLRKDHCGQMRQLEFIALPGTVFEVVAVPTGIPGVLQVRTNDYQAPSGTQLYVAAELLTPQLDTPPERKPQLPEAAKIMQQLRSAVGLPYVWGGNLRNGVTLAGQPQFAGLDCSGLLYEATDGYTPRNTEQLVDFGKQVAIEGKNIQELLQQLRPLDLIVWKGHVIIVLDQKTAVESILNCSGGRDGVVTTPLETRLKQLLKQRRPANSWPAGAGKSAHFVVRRWI